MYEGTGRDRCTGDERLQTEALSFCDSNEDGSEDLAIGIPYRSVYNAAGTRCREAGTVLVLYGNLTSGLTTTGYQVWSLRTPGTRGIL